METLTEIRLRNVPLTLKNSLEIEAAAANITLQDYVKILLEQQQKQQRAALVESLRTHHAKAKPKPAGTAVALIRALRDGDDS